MKATVFYLTASLVSFAFAMPSPGNAGAGVEARDNVKLNQYGSADDCKNDKNILYHAAPVSGRCYDLDDKTKTFFYNSAGFQNIKLYSNKGCTGTTSKLAAFNGECVDKGDKNSIKMW